MFLYFLISCIYVYINVINIIKINFGGHYEKILGLLALMVAVSGIASAEQDVLKSINFSTEVRQGWQDRKGQKANGIGNAGFKKDNRARTRWRNTVSGELSFVDEWGLNAYFNFKNDNDKL